MCYFQPLHTYILSPHLLGKFTFIVPIMLEYHNKHLFFLAKKFSKKACKHAHVQLFRDSAQCMVSMKKGACLYVVTSNDYV